MSESRTAADNGKTKPDGVMKFNKHLPIWIGTPLSFAALHLLAALISISLMLTPFGGFGQVFWTIVVFLDTPILYLCGSVPFLRELDLQFDVLTIMVLGTIQWFGVGALAAVIQIWITAMASRTFGNRVETLRTICRAAIVGLIVGGIIGLVLSGFLFTVAQWEMAGFKVVLFSSVAGFAAGAVAAWSGVVIGISVSFCTIGTVFALILFTAGYPPDARWPVLSWGIVSILVSAFAAAIVGAWQNKLCR